MKKILFSIAIILYSISCLGQQRVLLNDAVNITIPNRSQKITKEQALVHVHEKFNNDKHAVYTVSINDGDNTYKIDDILVYLYPNDKVVKIKENYLLSLKKGFDAIYYKDTTYTISIKKYNKNTVLIIHNVFNSIGYYHFYCCNSLNTRLMAGQLQFNNTDEKEANTILNDLLNSIQFKD